MYYFIRNLSKELLSLVGPRHPEAPEFADLSLLVLLNFHYILGI